MRGLAKLIEAGKRHSAGDQQMVQTVHDHAVSLGASCGTQEADLPTIVHPGIDTKVAESDLSYGDVSNLIRMALKAEYPGDNVYVWVKDVYDSTVVYEVSTGGTDVLYQRSYAVVDAAVTFGTAVPVIARTVYEPVSEAATGDLAESEEITGELVPLVEKAVKQDGTAKIKIIQAGQGSSGYYPADVLKRDASVFAEGTHIYLDHPTADEEKTRPERSIKDLAGSLTGPAVWEESGSAGPGLYAPVKFIDSVAPHINDIAPISGMSIRANGKVGTREIDGKKVRTIESITAASSIDVVTRAGAGGKIVDLIESARGRHTNPPERTDDMKELEEAQAEIKTLQETLTKQADELARIREAGILRDARAIVVEELAKTNFPALTKTRLTESLVNGAAAKDGALDTAALTAAIEAAVKDATAELTEATGGNPVRGMGSTTATTLTEADAQKALVESFVARGYSQEIAERMAAD